MGPIYLCGKVLRNHILDIFHLSNFHKISNGAFCQKDIDNLFEWFHPINTVASMPIYGKTLTKCKRKVQAVLQSQTAALPRPQEEEETDKSKQAQIEQTHEKH